MSGGERLPTVVGPDGLPDSTATAFCISDLRPGSGSHSTLEQTLRGVAGVRQYELRSGVEITARIRSGEGLTQVEIDEFLASLHAPGRGRRQLSPGTVSLRIGGAERYLRWSGERELSRLPASSAALPHLRDRLTSLLEALRKSKPRSRGRSGERLGLSPDQMSDLIRTLNERANKAEALGFDEAFLSDRELLWFDWQLETGLRMGELLGLRLRDLDFAEAAFRIVRRPDAADDPRADPARVKGLGRPLPLSPYLSERTMEHIKTKRAARPRASRHDFLFVALDGAPLSRSAVSK